MTTNLSEAFDARSSQKILIHALQIPNMAHETSRNKTFGPPGRQRASERWKRRRQSYTRTQWTGYRRSSIHATDDDVADGRGTGIAMPVAASAVPPPPSFTAVRIEQFLTDVRRRVYGPVTAACLGRGGGGGAEERGGSE